MDFVTVDDVAKELKVSRNFVYTLIKEGILPAHKFGNRIRIAKEQLQSYITQNATQSQE